MVSLFSEQNLGRYIWTAAWWSLAGRPALIYAWPNG